MMQDSYADSLWKSSTEWEKHLRGYIYIYFILSIYRVTYMIPSIPYGNLCLIHSSIETVRLKSTPPVYQLVITHSD